jgi:hypothetical protein
MDESMAVVLEVDAFGRGVSGEKDADRRLGRVRLEGGFDFLSFVQRQAAVDGEQAVVGGESFRGKDAVKPFLGGTVFGENDDALVGLFATGLEGLVEPVG